MTTDAPFTPPRKKPSILWWIGGAFMLLLLLFVFELFGPSPRIYVSPKTTFITEPLTADGLPDYAKYALNLYRDGVTPENNAAALLWPAVWPGELSANQYAAVATELGLDQIPAKADALVMIRKRIKDLQHEGFGAVRSDSGDNAANVQRDLQKSEDQLYEQVTEHPWTSKEIPPLAKWVHDNQKPLDQLVAGSLRTRCYFPSPSLLAPNPESLASMLLPGIQAVREGGRSLRARAMWNLGEHRFDAAWQDLFAELRIGHLMTQDKTLVDQLVGISISNDACNGTAILLQEGHPSPAQARQVMKDLASLESFSGVAESIDHMERATHLSLILLLAQGKVDPKELKLMGLENIAYSKYLAIDWNVALENSNDYFDRYAAAARLPTYAARKQAMAHLDSDLNRIARGFGADSIVAAILSRSARSANAAQILTALLMPAFVNVLDAQDRQDTKLDLIRLAAALAVFRAEHGNYPAKLEELVPTVLEKLPADLYNAKPFLYKPIGGSFLLYSAGENGIDDGGSNIVRHIFEGQEYDFDDESAPPLPQPIPASADDIAIRVPRLPTKMPSATTTPAPNERLE
ncbi:MAG TPA: hypothetical protein VHU84_18150 [Lacipirellulaceae bacterium]|jgi:hypothetical protein|nr:hypothetical protein [Lacipirellulaceae bacterium]